MRETDAAQGKRAEVRNVHKSFQAVMGVIISQVRDALRFYERGGLRLLAYPCVVVPHCLAVAFRLFGGHLMSFRLGSFLFQFAAQLRVFGGESVPRLLDRSIDNPIHSTAICFSRSRSSAKVKGGPRLFI